MKHYIKNFETKFILLKVSKEFWKSSSQHLIILIEKFLNSEVLDNISIIKWIFSNEMKNEFIRYNFFKLFFIYVLKKKRSYIWDILRNTISKTINQIENLKKQILNEETTSMNGFLLKFLVTFLNNYIRRRRKERNGIIR